VLLYGILRGRRTSRRVGRFEKDEEGEFVEKPLPRWPVIGCVVIACLVVLAGFAFVIIKYIL
jgi:hypothetical protein